MILGKGKATRYVLRRGIGGERQFPLYRVDERGKAHLFATLCPLYPADNCAVCDERSGEWQLYDGLPWYLNDLRPIGFLGRAWGKAAAHELNLPEDVRRWDEGQRLLALCRYGEDMTGDLLPGADSYQRWLMRETASLSRRKIKPSVTPHCLSRRWPGSWWVPPPVANNPNLPPMLS
ncbi:hypothetical protein AK51_25485 [Serratia nematodiphila DZ0503SBS1]|nr:hypothetical protein AK51_25485 [Serratia nematodiphila DZ0503SBS1]